MEQLNEFFESMQKVTSKAIPIPKVEDYESLPDMVETICGTLLTKKSITAEELELLKVLLPFIKDS